MVLIDVDNILDLETIDRSLLRNIYLNMLSVKSKYLTIMKVKKRVKVL